MRHTLENDVLRIEVEDHGAELRAITEKADGTEYLWNGDPAWWKYSSPVLFPIVGKLAGNKYRFGGREYELPSHGFGRLSDFACTREATDELIFRLDWSEETMRSYPFKFRLEIAYILKLDRVKVMWTVKNLDSDGPMYFSIGAHPALRCPIMEGEDFTDCYLSFNVEEKCERILLDSSGSLSRNRVPVLDGKELPLDYALFREDALVFDGLHSDEVSIRSRKSAKSVTVRAKGFPFWGFWTPVKGGAPFLCIEPWYGHADYVDLKGELSEKDGIQKLAPKESFDAGYSIIIGK